jgi:hypothetical protein
MLAMSSFNYQIQRRTWISFNLGRSRPQVIRQRPSLSRFQEGPMRSFLTIFVSLSILLAGCASNTACGVGTCQ